MSDAVRAKVKEFILSAFLPGEDPNELKDDTPLISGGILDSIATLKLVMFIEETFNVQVQAHEADKEHLDTITDIVALIASKK
ncbi:MAG: acyl carrier protein [Betaproteobacteria bacterium]|nr:acyl carrier protein [Betaproteobacteria bacterium]